MERVSAEPAPPTSDTEATLMASRALLGVVAGSLAPALDQVSLPVFRLLVVLTANGPLTVDDIASRIATPADAVQRMVDDALSDGWASIADSGFVHLEPRGRALVDEVTERRRSHVAAILATMEAAERERVSDALYAFALAAGEPPMESLLSLGL